MRRFFSVFYIGGIIIALLFAAAPQIITRAAKNAIAGVFPGAGVTIRACSIRPAGTCTLSGIEIQRPGIYRISVPSITVRPSASGRITIDEFQVDVSAAGGRSRAIAALRFARWGKEIASIAVDVPVMQGAGVRIINGSLRAAAGVSGKLAIERLNAGAFASGGISADTALDDNTLSLTNLSAPLFGGTARGSACVSLQEGMPYQASILVSRIDMAVMISELRFAERLELSGVVQGAAGVQGSFAGFGLLHAELRALAPGGVLNIRDQRVIDMIAERSGQARELISRSFTDYRYEDARARVYTRENKLAVDIEFRGEGGKRTLQALVHDFTGQGG
ncbi:MAG TPA: YdbH domain-containing protein [Candidatus Omnitrophota bacterium]|nr:YdbH domain-containing protein [Candidatus Omnitrophota bacterium]HNQ50688.1 YdbH domain-containing protein [Candidatus Omnitrophota bacterium]HQO37449.1 YdbH domain-containing protein [Candidatus Omnitrophota bacterium]HQQ05674.1 YdbH domain-containing protein [Candidatus Omnitrophota bacterium]